MPNQDHVRKVEAIVISHTEYGEADRFLTLFTREMGKVRAIAKGVRKARSRKAGHLEPFTRTALVMARGANFWIITQADTVDAYQPIRENLLKTAQAAYVLELLDRFSSEGEEHQSLYRLIKETLSRLTEEEDTFRTVRFFELRFLEKAGFRPEFFHCALCGAEIQAEDQYFSALQGGVLCPQCGSMTANVHPISMLALKYLRHFQRSDYDQIKTIMVPAAQQNEMEKLMQYYFAYLAEKKLNTPTFLREIRRHPQEDRGEIKL